MERDGADRVLVWLAVLVVAGVCGDVLGQDCLLYTSDRRGREIGLVLLGTRRERDALGTRYAGLEIVIARAVPHIVGACLLYTSRMSRPHGTSGRHRV